MNDVPAENVCQACGAAYPLPIVVCIKCGYSAATRSYLNVETGVEEHEEPVVDADGVVQLTDADAADEEEEEEQLSTGEWLTLYMRHWCPGLLRPSIVVVAILVGAIGLGICVMGLVMLVAFFALFTGAVMVGLGALAWGQATALILWGEFENLVSILAEFDSMQWALWFASLMLPGIVFILIANAMSTT